MTNFKRLPILRLSTGNHCLIQPLEVTDVGGKEGVDFKTKGREGGGREGEGAMKAATQNERLKV